MLVCVIQKSLDINLDCVASVPYEELSCILAAHKLEQEQKSTKLALAGQNAEKLFVGECLLRRLTETKNVHANSNKINVSHQVIVTFLPSHTSILQ